MLFDLLCPYAILSLQAHTHTQYQTKKICVRTTLSFKKSGDFQFVRKEVP